MKPVTRTFDEDTPLLTAALAQVIIDGGWLEGHATGLPLQATLRAIASGRAVVVPAGDTPGAESEVATVLPAAQKFVAAWRVSMKKAMEVNGETSISVPIHPECLIEQTAAIEALNELCATIDAALSGASGTKPPTGETK